MKCRFCGVDQRMYGHNLFNGNYCRHEDPAPKYIVEAILAQDVAQTAAATIAAQNLQQMNKFAASLSELLEELDKAVSHLRSTRGLRG